MAFGSTKKNGIWSKAPPGWIITQVSSGSEQLGPQIKHLAEVQPRREKKTADKISLQIFFPHITSVHFLLMSFFLLLHFYVFICTHATLCTILPHTHNFEIPTSIPPPAISITCSETRHPILSSSSRMFFCLDSLHLLIES